MMSVGDVVVAGMSRFYDQAFVLFINGYPMSCADGYQYYINDGSQMYTCTGTVYPSGIVVSFQHYFSALVPYVRVVYTLQNALGYTNTFTADIQTNLGSDALTAGT